MSSNCNSATNMTFDPGWNDPPKLTYGAQQTTPNRPRNFLNKRVAFPLSGSSISPTPAPSTPESLPPFPTNLSPLPAVHSNPKVLQPDLHCDIDSDATLEEVKGILFQILNESSALGAKINDIKRRLGVMEEMWKSGKLNQKIQMQMKELAYALRDNQSSKADDLHRALMVDYVSAVGTWMPGIKQIIHHHIARMELLAIDKE